MTDVFGTPSIFGVSLYDVAIVICIIVIIGSLVRIFYRTIKERKFSNR